MKTEQKKMVYRNPWLDLGRDLMQLVFLNDDGQSNVDLKYSTNSGWPAYQLALKGTSFDSGDTRYIIGLKKNRIYEMGEYEDLDRELKWLVIVSPSGQIVCDLLSIDWVKLGRQPPHSFPV